jgi:hypothetical protein
MFPTLGNMQGLFKVLSKEPKGLLEDYLKIMKGFT